MALAAGRLNKRVTLQTVTRTTDTGGGGTDSWGTTATLWAHIEELGGSEPFNGQQVASTLTHRVTLRYRSVTPQQRLLYGSRVLKIVAVQNPDQRNEMLVLDCREEFI